VAELGGLSVKQGQAFRAQWDHGGVSGDRAHFIQAALLGGFGRTPPGRKQRDAEIELRRKGSATTESTTPDKVGWVDKLYRLQDPGPGVDIG
jgi:hypothetical protein